MRRFGHPHPVVPGVMPIYNYIQLSRFSGVCGAEIPRWLRSRLQDCGDDLASLRSLGMDVVTDLCEQLLSGGRQDCIFIH